MPQESAPSYRQRAMNFFSNYVVWPVKTVVNGTINLLTTKTAVTTISNTAKGVRDGASHVATYERSQESPDIHTATRTNYLYNIVWGVAPLFVYYWAIRPLASTALSDSQEEFDASWTAFLFDYAVYAAGVVPTSWFHNTITTVATNQIASQELTRIKPEARLQLERDDTPVVLKGAAERVITGFISQGSLVTARALLPTALQPIVNVGLAPAIDGNSALSSRIANAEAIGFEQLTTEVSKRNGYAYGLGLQMHGSAWLIVKFLERTTGLRDTHGLIQQSLVNFFYNLTLMNIHQIPVRDTEDTFSMELMKLPRSQLEAFYQKVRPTIQEMFKSDQKTDPIELAKAIKRNIYVQFAVDYLLPQNLTNEQRFLAMPSVNLAVRAYHPHIHQLFDILRTAQSTYDSTFFKAAKGIGKGVAGILDGAGNRLGLTGDGEKPIYKAIQKYLYRYIPETGTLIILYLVKRHYFGKIPVDRQRTEVAYALAKITPQQYEALQALESDYLERFDMMRIQHQERLEEIRQNSSSLPLVGSIQRGGQKMLAHSGNAAGYRTLLREYRSKRKRVLDTPPEIPVIKEDGDRLPEAVYGSTVVIRDYVLTAKSDRDSNARAALSTSQILPRIADVDAAGHSRDERTREEAVAQLSQSLTLEGGLTPPDSSDDDGDEDELVHSLHQAGRDSGSGIGSRRLQRRKGY